MSGKQNLSAVDQTQISRGVLLFAGQPLMMLIYLLNSLFETYFESNTRTYQASVTLQVSRSCSGSSFQQSALTRATLEEFEHVFPSDATEMLGFKTSIMQHVPQDPRKQLHPTHSVHLARLSWLLEQVQAHALSAFCTLKYCLVV